MENQPKNIDLQNMSLKELKNLQKDVSKAVASYEERKRKEALDALEAKAQEMGFSLTELTGSTKKSSKVALPPKYQHPENSALTWSGRGRQPRWIKEGLDSGKSLNDFLIE